MALKWKDIVFHDIQNTLLSSFSSMFIPQICGLEAAPSGVLCCLLLHM